MNNDRDLTLSSRKIESREKIKMTINLLPIDSFKSRFEENIRLINNKFKIAEMLVEKDKYEEAKDVWRSQIVFLDSALDFYIHEISKYGILKMFDTSWEKTVKYKKLKIEMETVELGLKNTEDTSWFTTFAEKLNQEDCFMSYTKIKNQLNLIGLDYKAIAKEAFYEQGSTEKPIDKFKRRLNELYHRRNRIAHQADREHSTAERQDITKKEVEDFIKDITKIVEAIHNEASKKN